jgi:hypothetical protein
MKNIRIGNDIKIVWSILYEDAPFSLSGKDITIYLSCSYEKTEVKDFRVSGNELSWTFYGKDQKYTGKYSLELILNEGKEDMITVDARKFVNLVPHSCEEDGTDEPNIFVENVDLNTEIEFISGNTATPDWNASENEDGYIKNRTHYKQFGSWTNISISGGTANIYGISDYDYIILNSSSHKEPIGLDENKRYNVTFDGIGLVQITIIPANNNIKVVSTNGSISADFINENIRPFNIVPLGMEYLPKGLATEDYVNEKIAEIEISGGGSIDPETIEGFIPLSREFSDDFNNDFSR